MADITREVIRFQPANVERFIADYLESMLISRDMIYTSKMTTMADDVFDSSLQIAEIMKKEGVTLDKVEIGVKIIREELETSFNESKFNRKLRIIARLTSDCRLDEIRAAKIVNKVEELMAHYRKTSSCCSKVRILPIHHEAVKKTFDFHLRLNNLATTPDFLQDIQVNAATDEDEKDAKETSENFARREQAATKIQRWYVNLKQQEKHVKFQ